MRPRRCQGLQGFVSPPASGCMRARLGSRSPLVTVGSLSLWHGGTCRKWVGGSPALVKLERGGRTHLSRSSQRGPGYAPLPGEPGRQGEPSWDAHGSPEPERRSRRWDMGYLGSRAENSPAAEPRAVPGLWITLLTLSSAPPPPAAAERADPEPRSGAGCSGLQQRHRVGASRASAPRPLPASCSRLAPL